MSFSAKHLVSCRCRTFCRVQDLTSAISRNAEIKRAAVIYRVPIINRGGVLARRAFVNRHGVTISGEAESDGRGGA